MIMARHQKITEEFGPVTANNVCRHFRSIFNFTAAGFDEFPQNPVVILTQARGWHRERRRTRVISNADFPKWMKVVLAETEDARDIMLIGAFSGMRRSEIVRLAWEDVNLIEKKLHLDKTKNSDPLDLPLCQYLVDLIAARREKVGQSRWLFPSQSESGHVVEVKSFVKRISEASGVAFSMHDLRRGYATIGESLDLNLYSLKRLLNHRSHGDVTSRYVIANVERLRQPVERIAAKILEIANAAQGPATSEGDCSKS
jgi:integrase